MKKWRRNVRMRNFSNDCWIIINTYFVPLVFFIVSVSFFHLQFSFFYFFSWILLVCFCLILWYTWVLKQYQTQRTLCAAHTGLSVPPWKLFIPIESTATATGDRHRDENASICIHNLLCSEKRCETPTHPSTGVRSIYFTRYLRQPSNQVANGNWHTSCKRRKKNLSWTILRQLLFSFCI